MCKSTRSVFLSSVLALSAQSYALDMQFSGFGSVGGGKLSNEDLAYDGFDEDFATDPSVTFGFQINTTFNEKVSATGQLIAKGRDEYNVEAEWVYVTYSFNERWDARVGRFRMPALAYSNYLDVSYAYTWIRPPVETNRLTFSALEGYDLIYHGSLGDWDMVLQLFGGRVTDTQETINNEGTAEEYDANVSDLFGFHHIFSYHWLTLKIYGATLKSSATSSSEILMSTLNLIATLGQNPELANLLNPAFGSGVTYYGSAVHIDYNDWLFDAELSYFKRDDRNAFVSDDEAWHIMLGRRIGKLTYHITYAQREDDPFYGMIDTLPALVTNPSTGMPLPLQTTIANQVTNQTDTSITLGVRYDFAPATAFKFEVTSLKQETLLKERVLTPFDEEGTFVNFAIDFVF